MNELEGIGVLVALFALRCIAPLALTMAFAYLMNRLVDRWRAEDELLLQKEAITGPEPEPASNLKLPVVTVPCWILRNCEETKQEDCPAKKQSGVPCWLVRLTHEGQLPKSCPTCPIYARGEEIPVPVIA